MSIKEGLNKLKVWSKKVLLWTGLPSKKCKSSWVKVIEGEKLINSERSLISFLFTTILLPSFLPIFIPILFSSLLESI